MPALRSASTASTRRCDSRTGALRPSPSCSIGLSKEKLHQDEIERKMNLNLNDLRSWWLGGALLKLETIDWLRNRKAIAAVLGMGATWATARMQTC